MKECNKCKQVLALDMFYKRQSKCKQCLKIRDEQWYLDKSNYNKQYRLNNLEKVKQNYNQWLLNNPEHYKQYNTQLPPGVYMVKCLVNGKKYVGQSIKPHRRKTCHASIVNSKSKTNTNPNLQADLKQYGRKSFVFGIIEHCEPEQLLERETHYINLYKPEYNLTT